MKNTGEYRIEAFPSSRLSTLDIGAVGLSKHHIKALLEVDVTEARRMISEKKKLHENISFNAWLIKCIGQAVSEFPQLHGMRKGKKQLLLFHDVDISIVIEREVEGARVPLPYVIRKTNQKSIADIYEEIRSGQRQSIRDEGSYVLGERKNDRLMRLYYWLPGFIRRFIWRYIMGSPFVARENMGTVMVTSLVGTMSKVNGWVIPVSVHPLCFAIGSIARKPGIVDDAVCIREYLYMTVLVDHDVIDGAPAVRALGRLTRLIEGGYGLY